MNIQTIELRKLTPANNHYITQANLYDEKTRIFSDGVYLAVGDSPENWTEWTVEQKSAWEDEYVTENIVK